MSETPAARITLTGKQAESLRMLLAAVVSALMAFGVVAMKPDPAPAVVDVQPTAPKGDEPTPAPDLTVTVPATVEPFRLLDFNATLPGAWIPFDANDALDVRIYDGGKRGVVTGPPGPGRLTYVRVREDGSYFQETHRFTVGVPAPTKPQTPVEPEPSSPSNPAEPSAVTAVVYVYEKDETAVPSGVLSGLNRLNREKKIIATAFEDDTSDGDGDVPDQYKAALAAARQGGMPALVVLAGDTALKVVKSPTTEADVMGAVQ